MKNAIAHDADTETKYTKDDIRAMIAGLRTIVINRLGSPAQRQRAAEQLARLEAGLAKAEEAK